MSKLSYVSTAWLKQWINSQGKTDCFTVPQVYEELGHTRFAPLKSPITLYRELDSKDLVSNDVILYDPMAPWTYDINKAKKSGGRVIEVNVESCHVFFDTTRIDAQFYRFNCCGDPDEKEVVLLPGKYSVKLV